MSTDRLTCIIKNTSKLGVEFLTSSASVYIIQFEKKKMARIQFSKQNEKCNKLVSVWKHFCIRNTAPFQARIISFERGDQKAYNSVKK